MYLYNLDQNEGIQRIILFAERSEASFNDFTMWIYIILNFPAPDSSITSFYLKVVCFTSKYFRIFCVERKGEKGRGYKNITVKKLYKFIIVREAFLFHTCTWSYQVKSVLRRSDRNVRIHQYHMQLKSSNIKIRNLQSLIKLKQINEQSNVYNTEVKQSMQRCNINYLVDEGAFVLQFQDLL